MEKSIDVTDVQILLALLTVTVTLDTMLQRLQRLAMVNDSLGISFPKHYNYANLL